MEDPTSGSKDPDRVDGALGAWVLFRDTVMQVLMFVNRSSRDLAERQERAKCADLVFNNLINAFDEGGFHPDRVPKFERPESPYEVECGSLQKLLSDRVERMLEYQDARLLPAFALRELRMGLDVRRTILPLA